MPLLSPSTEVFFSIYTLRALQPLLSSFSPFIFRAQVWCLHFSAFVSSLPHLAAQWNSTSVLCHFLWAPLKRSSPRNTCTAAHLRQVRSCKQAGHFLILLVQWPVCAPATKTFISEHREEGDRWDYNSKKCMHLHQTPHTWQEFYT